MLSACTVDTEHVDAALLVRLVGSLDGANNAELRAAVQAKLDPRVDRLLFDLSGVEYLSSAGVGLLVSFLTQCRSLGARVGCFGLHDDSQQIFRLTRLDQVFEIYPDRETALADRNQQAPRAAR